MSKFQANQHCVYMSERRGGWWSRSDRGVSRAKLFTWTFDAMKLSLTEALNKPIKRLFSYHLQWFRHTRDKHNDTDCNKIGKYCLPWFQNAALMLCGWRCLKKRRHSHPEWKNNSNDHVSQLLHGHVYISQLDCHFPGLILLLRSHHKMWYRQ